MKKINNKICIYKTVWRIFSDNKCLRCSKEYKGL